MNTSEISRVNELAKLAMDSTDQSSDGVQKRERAKQALIDAMGTDLAAEMMKRYEGLSGNSKAIAESIEASKSEFTSEQERLVGASQLGVEGINEESLLFSSIADGEIEGQKLRANELGAKIDELLSNGEFLKSVSSEELTRILKSVQEGDQIRRNKLSMYKDQSAGHIATIGGTLEAFAKLVDQEIKQTRDYLDQLSANFTRIAMTSGGKFKEVLGSAMKNISKIGDNADVINQTLRSDMLSIGPIEEGLEERLNELMENQNKFAAKTRRDIKDLIKKVDDMNNEISVGRVSSLEKLRNSNTQLSDSFRSKAMEYQANKADIVSRKSSSRYSFIESESNKEIRQDIRRRIKSLGHLAV
jgi:hypothetical protein